MSKLTEGQTGGIPGAFCQKPSALIKLDLFGSDLVAAVCKLSGLRLGREAPRDPHGIPQAPARPRGFRGHETSRFGGEGGTWMQAPT